MRPMAFIEPLADDMVRHFFLPEQEQMPMRATLSGTELANGEVPEREPRDPQALEVFLNV